VRIEKSKSFFQVEGVYSKYKKLYCGLRNKRKAILNCFNNFFGGNQMATWEVRYQTSASSSVATTTENGNSEAEVREKIRKRYKNLTKIISIKRR
jgi:hypothetical protein